MGKNKHKHVHVEIDFDPEEFARKTRDSVKRVVSSAMASANVAMEAAAQHAERANRQASAAQKPPLTPNAGKQSRHARSDFHAGDLVLLLIGLLLSPLWIVITILMIIGPAFEMVGRTLVATATSVFVLIAHVSTPRRARALRVELVKDWRKVGDSFARMLHRAARPWGLGNIVGSVRERWDELSTRFEQYVSQASDPEHTPQEFREHYHVVDELPSGGSSARVFIVRKAGGNAEELFVLKHFDLTDGGRLESVVRESQAVELAKRLGLILDSQLGKKSFYYVMPYYRGDAMTQRVVAEVRELPKNQAPRDEYQQLALGWVHQLLQLIAQYHDAGVIHKDIKPDNLIINGEYLHLVDIGLMTPLESLQQLTTHGTEYFRDPDMVRMAMAGQAVRDVNAAKFDIYAIGAVLYFLFEGDIPSSGALSRFGRGIPRALQMVVSRAMAPFDQRYGTARAMLADIDYLCWAASQGSLSDVRPAELPSFRSEGGDVQHPSQAIASAAAYPPGYSGHQGHGANTVYWKDQRRGNRRSALHSIGGGITTVIIFGGIWLFFMGGIEKSAEFFRGTISSSAVSSSELNVSGQTIKADLERGAARDLVNGVKHFFNREEYVFDLGASNPRVAARAAESIAIDVTEMREMLATSLKQPDLLATLPVSLVSFGEGANALKDQLTAEFGARMIPLADPNLIYGLAIREEALGRLSQLDGHGTLIARYIVYVREQQALSLHADLLPITLVLQSEADGSTRVTTVFPSVRAAWQSAPADGGLLPR